MVTDYALAQYLEDLEVTTLDHLSLFLELPVFLNLYLQHPSHLMTIQNQLQQCAERVARAWTVQVKREARRLGS